MLSDLPYPPFSYLWLGMLIRGRGPEIVDARLVNGGKAIATFQGHTSRAHAGHRSEERSFQA